MAVGGRVSAEVDLAQVGSVGQYSQYLLGGPKPAGGGAVAAVVEDGGDRACAIAVAGVDGEDGSDDSGFGRVDRQDMSGGVHEVAEGAFASFPFAFGCFAFHACDDTVDDGVAFELGKHAEHLNEHPAHRGGGIERLGGRAEYDPGAVEFVEQHHHVAQVAREPVDAVDEKDIDQTSVGGGYRLLQAWSVGARSGGIVMKAGDASPPWLGVDVGIEPSVLGLDGIRLMFVIGRAAHVNSNPDVVAKRRKRRSCVPAFECGRCHLTPLLADG
nr:hypothetical protein [Nocardia brasiliensis]